MIDREFEGRIRRSEGRVVDVPIRVTLSYDADTNPFAVEGLFEIPGVGERIWVFGRELLQQGCISLTPFGGGDIKFRRFPLQGVVVMCLKNSGGHADIELPSFEVEAFLGSTVDAALHGTAAVGGLVDDFLKEMFEA
jgi:hypothetical protein